MANLKNNYNGGRPSHFTDWVLNYNRYFSIAGIADNIPEEVQKIVDLLDIEREIEKRVDE